MSGGIDEALRRLDGLVDKCVDVPAAVAPASAAERPEKRPKKAGDTVNVVVIGQQQINNNYYYK